MHTNCGFFYYFSASSGHPFLQNGPTVARLRATVPDKFRQFIWQHCCSYPSNILWYLSWCLWNYCSTISFLEHLNTYHLKVKKILKGSLDLITSPSTSVKDLNYGRESLLEVYRQNIAGLLTSKKLLTSHSNVLLYYISKLSSQ